MGAQGPHLAEQRLKLLASELDRTWPDAACSLREGMSETLTLMRLGIGGQLAKTLCSTNPCESMIEIVRHTQRNVKRWQEGDMRKRWTAAGMLVAEQQFRRSPATATSPNSSSRSNDTQRKPLHQPPPPPFTPRHHKPLLSDRQIPEAAPKVLRRSGHPPFRGEHPWRQGKLERRSDCPLCAA